MSSGPLPPTRNLTTDSSVMYHGNLEDRGFPMANHILETSMTSVLEEGRLRDFGGRHTHIGPSDQAYEDERTSSAQTYGENAMSVASGGATSALLAIQSSQTRNCNAAAKSKFWIQRIVEGLKVVLHILTPDGRILYTSESSKRLAGYSPEELTDKLIVDFIHPDDSAIFVRELNDSIASGGPLRLFYRFRRQTGDYEIFEVHGHPHISTKVAPYGHNSSAPRCGGFFIMARPYPAKNAAKLDSFLEQKIENDRLIKKIEILRHEEAEGQNYCHQHWKDEEAQWDQYFSDDHKTSVVVDHSSAEILAMPPPVIPQTITPASTHQSYENATVSINPDSVEEKAMRYGGTAHIETIEMLTGLRYQDGERSQGISTGDTSPTLIRGNTGLNIFGEGRGGDKKKKIKIANEYSCTDCGTLDSPEWRKGPEGPKTLCNACGLRWAKREKKKTGPNIESGSGDLDL